LNHPLIISSSANALPRHRLLDSVAAAVSAADLPLDDYFFGEAAGLAASFFAPLLAFTSTSVADIV